MSCRFLQSIVGFSIAATTLAAGAKESAEAPIREALAGTRPNSQQLDSLRQQVIQEAGRVGVPALIRNLRRSRSVDNHGQQLMDSLVAAHARLLQVEEERGRLSWVRETLRELESKPEVFVTLAKIPSISGTERQQVTYAALLKELGATDESLRAAILLRQANARIKEIESLDTGKLLPLKDVPRADHVGEPLPGGLPAHTLNHDLDVKQLNDRLAVSETAKPKQPERTVAARQDYDLSILSTLSAGQAPDPSLPLPESPDARLVEVELHDLQNSVDEISRLRVQWLAFAQPIGLRSGLPMEQAYRANHDLLIGRGFVLCRLWRTLGDALRDRKLLQIQLGRYDRRLRLARGAAGPSRVVKPAEERLDPLQQEIRDLSNRYTLLAQLKRRQLKTELESYLMAQDRRLDLKNEVDGLAWADTYPVVCSAAERKRIESEFSKMTSAVQDVKRKKLRQDHGVKLAAYRRLAQNADGGDADEAVLLAGPELRALRRCRTMLNDTAAYAALAEAVAANSEHAAEMLEEVEHAPQLPTKNAVMLSSSGKDAKVLETLRVDFSAGNTAGNPSSTDGPLEVPSK